MKFFKFLIALALMPFVAGEIWTLYDVMRISVPDQWRAGWFISFWIGFAVWLVVFFFLPRTMWLYVLGHEFTHALAAMLAGGKVSAFKVTSKGGHIMTDKVNWWIALSPYFVPIYAVIWIALWVTVDFYHPLKPWVPILFFGVGLFWAFHLTFTASMMHSRQTDLLGEGQIFSWVIIILANLLGFLVLFSVLSHNVPMAWKTFMHRITQSYVFTGNEIMLGAAWLQNAWQTRHI